METLLQKEAIAEVPDREAHLVSSLFAIPKKESEKLRPILNLRVLSSHVRYQHFKMEGLATVRDLLQPGDFMVKVDLTDAFFHIPIDHKHRKYLQFRWQNQLYQFNCLPFGLASAPRTFTKFTKPILTQLRGRGFRIVIYIDDILLLASSWEKLLQQLEELLSLLQALGLSINWENSILEPTQSLTYLGVGIDSIQMEFFLPADKVKKFQEACRDLWRKVQVTVRDLASVLGLLASTS